MDEDAWVPGDGQAGVERDADPVVLELDLEERPRRGGQALLGGAIAVTVVIVLLLMVTALRRDQHGVPELVRDDHREDAITLPDTSVPDDVAVVTVPVPSERSLAIGSPIDGKASKLLPVQVTPDHDLVDGQRVTVTGHGFPPNVSVGAVMCTAEATVSGSAMCNIMDFASGQTDANGDVSVMFVFHRYLTVGAERVDCQLGNIEPAQFKDRLDRQVRPVIPQGVWRGCLLAIGQITDYDESGGSPVLMRGATAVPMPEGDASNTPPTTPTAPPTVPAPTSPVPSTPATPATPPPPVPTTFPPGAAPVPGTPTTPGSSPVTNS